MSVKGMRRRLRLGRVDLWKVYPHIYFSEYEGGATLEELDELLEAQKALTAYQIVDWLREFKPHVTSEEWANLYLVIMQLVLNLEKDGIKREDKQ
jgi:2'-5' RNA ligase